MSPSIPSDRGHRLWIRSIIALILTMVAIGGVTRLTGSGLSITDWAPFMGAIPPLNEEAWNAVFAKYQASPQYQKVNAGMSLADFKFIYFWEYFHRLVGRMIGFVVLLPAIYFAIKKRLPRRLAVRVAIGFALGGLQGLLGWLMVKSGLVDRPSVSHFRLAAHFGLALAILAYFVWLLRDLETSSSRAPVSRPDLFRFRSDLVRFRTTFAIFLGAFILQLTYGAFVAGLKAGFTYNTFPLMNGSFLPTSAWAMEPAWRNALDNPVLVQWIHRYLGKAVLILSVVLWAFGRKIPALTSQVTELVRGVGVQVLLGVLTLLFHVPLALGVLHQVVAALLVALVTITAHDLRALRVNAQ